MPHGIRFKSEAVGLFFVADIYDSAPKGMNSGVDPPVLMVDGQDHAR